MIKKIHYCWFGRAKKPDEVINYIETWKKNMPDFEIIEWNEGNFDIQQCAFASQAYFLKRYAFVSDYVRMKVLYEHGGLYLDTDIKILKPMESLCEKGDFLGLECDGRYGTGILYATPKALWVKRMIDFYESHSFIKSGGMLRTKPNTYLLTSFFPNNSIGINIYPYDYLTAKNWKTGEYETTENTYCIHDYAKSWVNKDKKNYGPKFRFYNLIKVLKWWFVTKIFK